MNGITSNLIGPGINASSGASGDKKSLEQVQKLGKEFEGVFMSFLLKEMRNTVEGGLFPGDSSDTYGGMFDLFLGQHLADATPLGISDLVTETYAKRAKQASAEGNESGKNQIEVKG